MALVRSASPAERIRAVPITAKRAELAPTDRTLDGVAAVGKRANPQA
jgi:hypothetical protein